MINIINIWKSSYLGKTLKDDRPFGLALIVVLGIYAIIHIVKLEVFPFYMFAMYSQPEEPKEFYTTVRINESDTIFDKNGIVQSVLDNVDYRSYTYLINTLHQYDGIVSNNMVHPESKVYDKFINRIGLSGSQLDRSFKTPYIYDKTTLEQSLNNWLNKYHIQRTEGHTLVKNYYTWNSDIIMIHDKTEFYELGK